MAGNSNYAVTGYTAFAIEQKIDREWNDNVSKEFPLLAAIFDMGTNWNKGYSVKGTKVIVPLMISLVTGMNTGNAGIAQATEIPSAWPTYDPTQGFTQASYDLTHIGRSMTVKESEKVRAGGRNGERGNLIDGKTDQLMLTFTSVVSDMMAGSQGDSETSLMGLDFAISTSNVVGGIDQGGEPAWRGGVQTSTGAFSLPVIDNAMDLIEQNGSNKKVGPADLLLLSYNAAAGGVNTYGRVRSQIAPAERIVNANFKAKYGFENFEYRGAKCVQDNRGAAGTAKLLTTGSWLYGGNKKPVQKSVQRILGSDADEYFFTLWCFLACREVRRNFRWTGING